MMGLLDNWQHWHDQIEAVAHHADGADDGERLRPVSPVSGGHLFCAGANYRQHVKELMLANNVVPGDPEEVKRRMGELDAGLDAHAQHGNPYVWLGLSSSMCGARDDIVIPDGAEQPDWELELAVVIGRRARRVLRADAMSYVAGYTVCNDITLRERVYRPDLPTIGTDWLWGKSAPTFFPIGPWIVPADQVTPSELRLTLRLNDQIMQDETTADMLFGIPRLIEHVSTIAELNPGDVLLTGSPAGNGVHYNRYLQPGDVMVGEITGVGRLVNRCVSDAAGHS